MSEWTFVPTDLSNVPKLAEKVPMPAPTLTEFLLARIADDEARARDPWLHVLADVKAWWDAEEDEPGFFADDQPDDVKGLAKTLMQIEHARGTYARVLAECEAKRRIVEWVVAAQAAAGEPPGMCREDAEALTHALRLLALPYADHTDYDASWRP